MTSTELSSRNRSALERVRRQTIAKRMKTFNSIGEERRAHLQPIDADADEEKKGNKKRQKNVDARSA